MFYKLVKQLEEHPYWVKCFPSKESKDLDDNDNQVINNFIFECEAMFGSGKYKVDKLEEDDEIIYKASELIIKTTELIIDENNSN